MSGNEIIMSRSLKRKIVIDDELEGKTKKNAQYCTDTTKEEIEIVLEEITLESDKARSIEEEFFKRKYRSEFFKYPYLPTMRKRDRYTRNDSKKSNLLISDIESKLRNSKTTLTDSVDIIQVTEYPVSKAEIECYHRISFQSLFYRLRKNPDTMKNNTDNDKISHNVIVSVNNNAQHFPNTVVNSCNINESTLALTNLASSRSAYSPNEINNESTLPLTILPSSAAYSPNEIDIPFEELQKAIDTIKKVFGNDFECQNEIEIVSVESNVGLASIKSPSIVKENSDDEYEVFKPYYDTGTESNESNSVVSSGHISFLSIEDMEGHEFVATENINHLSDKEGIKFPFYINDKDMETEKNNYDGFAYDITDRETNSCGLNENHTSNEKFFCNFNSEKETATVVEKSPQTDSNSEKIDNLNLFEKEKVTDDINLLESKKSIGNSLSVKTVEDSKSTENKMSQSFYGNRVSNRGTFLTQKLPIKPLSKAGSSKKKTLEVNRNLNTSPEKLHALIKTPDINIDLSRLHSHGNGHKGINSSLNRPNKILGMSSHSDVRMLVKDQQNTPEKSRYQIYAENNVTKQNTSLSYSPVPITSPVLINNNMNVPGTALNVIPSTNFMPGTVAHLNPLSVSGGYTSSQHDINRFPCYPLAPIYAVHHPFQPYANPRVSASFHPLQLQSYMHPKFISPVHPPQLTFQAYADARTQTGSFMFHNNFDSSSEIDNSNENSNNSTPPTNAAKYKALQSTPVMLPPNMPQDTLIPVTFSFANDVSLKSFDKETEASEIQTSNGKCLTRTSSNSDILSSSSFKTFVTHADEISEKLKCLVPSHMKFDIGSKIFKTEDVRLLILEWDVDSFIHHQNNKESPPLSCIFKKLSNSYENFEDYYNTFSPLLMLETWKRVCTSFSRLNVTKPFSAEIISYGVEKDHVIVNCKTLYNTDPNSHPEAGNIVIVNYGTKSDEHTVKSFGYLIKSKLRCFDPEADTEICKYYTGTEDTDTECYKFPVLTFAFITAYDSKHIDKQLPVRIELLYALKYSLKQHDALLFVKNSPLEKYILRPNTEELLRFSVNPKNSEEEITNCVEKVKETISSPHSLPVITLIKTETNSDHLKIISLLIQRIKNNCNNIKVLVCVRKRGTIADIASKLTSLPDLKFIIVSKSCNISLDFRKFLFDVLAKKKIGHIKTIPMDKNVLKEEIFKIKKEIVQDTDVIISWARDIHNDIVSQAFSDTKSISNTCCIIDEAHYFTEPESLIPILYGISKLILIGNTESKAQVLSKTAITYDFDKSFFHRAYGPVTSPD